MKRVIVLLIALIFSSLNYAMANATEDRTDILNDIIDFTVKRACIEKQDPMLKECSIPEDKCKRYATLVAKNCVGRAFRLSGRKSIKEMNQKEFIALVGEAGTCTGERVPLVSYYVCPENHEQSWAGVGGYK